MQPVTILSQEDTSTPEDTKFQFKSSNYKGHLRPKCLNFINMCSIYLGIIWINTKTKS